MGVGESVLLHAVAKDEEGNPLVDPPVSWESLNTEVATVTDGGLVSVITAGSARFRAECDGAVADAEFQVSRVGVAELRMHKVPCAANVGDMVHLMATAHDQFGELLRGRVIVWTANNPQIAAVDNRGVVRMLAPGRAVITASNAGKTAMAQIESKPAAPVACRVVPAAHVLSVNEEVKLNAEAVTAKGLAIPGSQIKWATSNPSVATVDDDGRVRAHSGGTAIVAAEAGGKKATARITVRLMRI